MTRATATVKIGDLIFDSAFPCGNGYDFTSIGRENYRFRTRHGQALYSWRFYFRILSPGDGRIITLEVADFNHAGRTVWNESAAVYSIDRENWTDVGMENISLTEYTPPSRPVSYGDACHVPYGVRYTLRLNAPELWFAVPLPFTLEDRDRLFEKLGSEHPEFTRPEWIGETYRSPETGFPITGMELTDFSIPPTEKIRCVVIAGEHPSESAGMYACRGMMEALAENSELLKRFDFHFIPILNVDGVFSGRSYHNTVPGGDSIGYNISLDYESMEHPETRGVTELVKKAAPHFFLRLHNGRHRDQFECFINHEWLDSPMIMELKKTLTIPLEHVRKSDGKEEWIRRHCGTPVVMTFETLLLRKNPLCQDWKTSYIRVGKELLAGIANGLETMKKQLRMEAEK